MIATNTGAVWKTAVTSETSWRRRVENIMTSERPKAAPEPNASAHTARG